MNTAEVVGTPADSNGDPIPGAEPLEDENTAAVEELEAGIQVIKEVFEGSDATQCAASAFDDTSNELVTGANGLPVTYCFEVENTGTSNLTDVALTDLTLPGVTLTLDAAASTGTAALLEPGEVLVFSGLGTIDGDLVNTAEVVGTPADSNGDPIPGATPLEDDDTAEVQELVPGIQVIKEVFDGSDATQCAASAFDNTSNELVTGANGLPVTYCFDCLLYTSPSPRDRG